MANQTPTIAIRNLNYIQNAKVGTLKPHLVAEALTDVTTAYGALAGQLNEALARIAVLEKKA